MNRIGHRGFTLVELLIVIVVIAILAAITIISYRGITQRAYAAEVGQAASDWVKILTMYKSENGTYPAIEGYSCLGDASQFPATSDFDAGVCYKVTVNGTTTTDAANSSLMADIRTIASPPSSTTPLLSDSSEGESAKIRGFLYYYSGSSEANDAALVYFLPSGGSCPQGVMDDGAGYMGCTIQLSIATGATP